MEENHKILLKGFVFVALFFSIFAVIYFTTSPVSNNPFFTYGAMLIYLISILLFSIEIFKNFKKDKLFRLILIIILIMVITRVLIGAIPYRLIIYTSFVKDAIAKLKDDGAWFIRFFGMTVFLKLSGIIFGKISLRTFSYFSSFISFLGLTAVYLISKKIHKSRLIAFIPLFLILSNNLINFYFGSEEFSSFAIAFLMIAYYFMFEQKPLGALFSFITAAFSRTEVFLLLPFFIAQYWYVNKIDFNFKNEIKKIKQIPTKKLILFTSIGIFLFIELFFFVTNLAQFYSTTKDLELFGPKPQREKAILSYMYYHFTYNITSRIFNNLKCMITEFRFLVVPFLKEALNSSIVFLLFISSLLLGRKNKKIQIFAFNVFFFFVLYVIIRYDGFINGTYRYTIFPTYFMAMIAPYFLRTLKRNKMKTLSLFLSIAIILALSSSFASQLYYLKDIPSKIYWPFSEPELKEIRENLNDDCNFIFITEQNRLLLTRAPKKLEVFGIDDFRLSVIPEQLNSLMSQERCLYAIIPSTSQESKIGLPNFYKQAMIEGWCNNKNECDEKLITVINTLKRSGFTEIIRFNKSSDDLGGIYYWEQEKQN